MTPSHTTPGVHIEETPPGVRAIEGVPTSVTAFVGRALRGPVDRPVGVTSLVEVERTFGPLWAESGLGYAVRAYFVNGGTSAVVVRVVTDATSARIAVDGLELEASSPGTWADVMTAEVSHPTADEAAAAAQALGLADGSSLFTLQLSCGPETEVFAHVTTAPGPRSVDTALESSRLARVRGQVPTTRPAARAYEVTTPGHDGGAPDHDSYLPADGSSRGIRALDGTDLVNIVVLPPVSPGGQLSDSVWAPALDYAVQRRALLIVDPPPDLPRDEVADWLFHAGLTGRPARNGAVYYPRLLQTDPLDGTPRPIAPSGAVAGVYARTDAARGVWKAPAGTAAGLVDVVGPSVALTDADSGALNPLGINALRAFPGSGTVVWGSRTLAGADVLADEYKYVPVRRLALFIEESLLRGTQWAVFEPNGEPLWAELRVAVDGFLHSLFRQGAFQGTTAREAYFVTCDRSTMTQADVAAGVVTVLVGFAPLKPAEFLVLRLQTRAAASL